mgnify:CR=1 FL=1
MFITCNNCNKKFTIDSALIPDKGRLLQCSACDHKWFFIKNVINKPEDAATTNKNNLKVQEPNKIFEKGVIQNDENIEFLEKEFSRDNLPDVITEDTEQNIDSNAPITKKKFNILGLITVFIISFIALIIFLDTFKSPIGKIVPNIEFLLYNLYETINDIGLFLKDLI